MILNILHIPCIIWEASVFSEYIYENISLYISVSPIEIPNCLCVIFAERLPTVDKEVIVIGDDGIRN